MMLKLTTAIVFVAAATPAPVQQPACNAPPADQGARPTLAQGGLQWCCCGACCGYAHDCKAVPGCTSC